MACYTLHFYTCSSINPRPFLHPKKYNEFIQLYSCKTFKSCANLILSIIIILCISMYMCIVALIAIILYIYYIRNNVIYPWFDPDDHNFFPDCSWVNIVRLLISKVIKLMYACYFIILNYLWSRRKRRKVIVSFITSKTILNNFCNACSKSNHFVNMTSSRQ